MNSKGAMGRMGGMFRMGKQKKQSQEDKVMAASVKTIRELVGFTTSMAYTGFQLEDQRTKKDVEAYLKTLELEYPIMADLVPVSIILTLMNPKYAKDVDSKEVVNLLQTYVGQATYAVHLINNDQDSMGTFLQVRDTILRLMRSNLRFCEIVAAVNSFSGYLQKHDKATDVHAQFMHRALLTVTGEYRKRAR